MTIRFTQTIQFGPNVVHTFAGDNPRWRQWECKKIRGAYRFEDHGSGKFYEVPASLCIVEGKLDEKAEKAE